ncbi:MAG TPA: carboxymuconolactone decarboxylase family protein [Thermodesulfovibrionales bacterium]|nr:carboxymuconolactone decarboxylase family protein [Thermodesulfovibrionales bacterium]
MSGKKDELVKKAQEAMQDESLADALAGRIEERRGGLGFLLSALKKRPRTFNPHVLKGISLYDEPSALDRRTAELVAVSAASALRCEQCLDAHIDGALRAGASFEEILDALLISAAITESSTLAVALRRFRLKEGKAQKVQSGGEEGGT